MPISDILVMAGVLVGTPILAFTFHRAGARGLRLFAATFTAFAGLVVTLMMATHSVEVAWNARRGAGTTMAGTTWGYDFRAYSLLLLGVLLLVQGVGLLRSAPGIGRGDADARRRATVAAAIVFAAAAPLIPIHTFFGILLSALALLVLGAIAIGGAGRRRKPDQWRRS